MPATQRMPMKHLRLVEQQNYFIKTGTTNVFKTLRNSLTTFVKAFSINYELEPKFVQALNPKNSPKYILPTTLSGSECIKYLKTVNVNSVEQLQTLNTNAQCTELNQNKQQILTPHCERVQQKKQENHQAFNVYFNEKIKPLHAQDQAKVTEEYLEALTKNENSYKNLASYYGMYRLFSKLGVSNDMIEQLTIDDLKILISNDKKTVRKHLKKFNLDGANFESMYHKVHKPLNALFTMLNPDCYNQSITFVDSEPKDVVLLNEFENQQPNSVNIYQVLMEINGLFHQAIPAIQENNDLDNLEDSKIFYKAKVKKLNNNQEPNTAQTSIIDNNLLMANTYANTYQLFPPAMAYQAPDSMQANFPNNCGYILAKNYVTPEQIESTIEKFQRLAFNKLNAMISSPINNEESPQQIQSHTENHMHFVKILSKNVHMSTDLHESCIQKNESTGKQFETYCASVLENNLENSTEYADYQQTRTQAKKAIDKEAKDERKLLKETKDNLLSRISRNPLCKFIKTSAKAIYKVLKVPSKFVFLPTFAFSLAAVNVALAVPRNVFRLEDRWRAEKEYSASHQVSLRKDAGLQVNALETHQVIGNERPIYAHYWLPVHELITKPLNELTKLINHYKMKSSIKKLLRSNSKYLEIRAQRFEQFKESMKINRKRIENERMN